MFKQKAEPALPTWYQWKKAQTELPETLNKAIEKILCTPKWNTVTFITDEFRYSCKFETEEEFNNAIEALRELEVHVHVLYFQWEASTLETDIICNPIKSADEAASLSENDFSFVVKAKFFSWGFVIEPGKLPALSKADKSRKSGRFSQPA